MKPTTPTQLRAVSYSRYSTDRQTDASIKDQQRVATEYAAKHNLALTMHHSDAGISGGAMGNRPGVLRMLEDAIAGRFDVLLVTDTTRLSRSNADLSKTVDRLRSRGVRVIGIQDGFDSASRTARMQVGLSGIMSEEFRAQIADRTRSALEMRAKNKRPVGGRTFGYGTGARTIDTEQAAIVRQIFDWYVAGWSNRTIAAELNSRRVPSPGGYWTKRAKRRSTGWMGSCIRAMLSNPVYAGTRQWNTSVWTKDPDSGKRRRSERPRDEWVVQKDESLRIVSDVTWQAAQRRTRSAADGDARLKAGGKARFLLSGLLVCAKCGSHYVMGDGRNYCCSSFAYGKACDNGIRVKRTHLEDVLLGPIKNDLLADDRVQRIAREMQQAFAAQAKAAAQRSQEAPAEVQALDARLARLRDRLKAGDADGLDGNSRAAAKARVTLRQLVGGRITLRPEADGSLWAEYGLRKTALIQACGTYGSGGLIMVGLPPTVTVPAKRRMVGKRG